jgi:hypothetical protein
VATLKPAHADIGGQVNQQDDAKRGQRDLHPHTGLWDGIGAEKDRKGRPGQIAEGGSDGRANQSRRRARDQTLNKNLHRVRTMTQRSP